MFQDTILWDTAIKEINQLFLLHDKRIYHSNCTYIRENQINFICFLFICPDQYLEIYSAILHNYTYRHIHLGYCSRIGVCVIYLCVVCEKIQILIETNRLLVWYKKRIYNSHIIFRYIRIYYVFESDKRNVHKIQLKKTSKTCSSSTQTTPNQTH